jgi:hypothetical protein
MTQAYISELLTPWKQFPRTLLLYASAGLIGAILLEILSVSFPPAPKTSPAPSDERHINPTPRNTPGANLTSQQDVQLAMVGNDIGLIRSLLENKERDPSKLTSFLSKLSDEKSLARRYPAGFVLFYSDGRKTLYSVPQFSPEIGFDPSTVEAYNMTITSTCITGVKAKIYNTHINLENDCFFVKPGASMVLLSVGGVKFTLESLGGSASGAAWIIGISK